MNREHWWTLNARLLARRFALAEPLPFCAGGDAYTGDHDQLLAIHAHPHGARAVRLYLPSPPTPRADEIGDLWEIPLLLTPRGVWLVLWSDPSAVDPLGEISNLGLALRACLFGALARRGWRPSRIPLGFAYVLHELDRGAPLGGLPDPSLAQHLVYRDDLDRLYERIVETALHVTDPDPCAVHRLLVDLLDLGEVVDVHEPAWTAHIVVPEVLLPRHLLEPRDEAA